MGAPLSEPGTWSTHDLPDGSYDLRLVATDRFGNESGTINSGITVDNTLPSAEITDPRLEDNAIRSGTIDVKGGASDLNFDRYEVFYSSESDPYNRYRIGDPGTSPVTDDTLVQWDTSDLLPGKYNVYLTVFDKAGNQAGASTIVTVDNAPPEVQVATPGLTSYHSGTVAVIGTVREDHPSSTRVLVAPGSNPAEDDFELLRETIVPVENGELAEMDTRLLRDGPATLRVVSVDSLGNRTVKNIGFYVDNTMPAVALTYPADDDVIVGKVSVTGRVNDMFLQSYAVQYAHGTDPSAGQWIELAAGTQNKTGKLAAWDTAGLEPGRYVLRVRATDRVGHVIEKLVSVRIPEPGDIGISIENGAEYTRYPEVLLRITKPGARFMRFRNSGQNWSDWRLYSSRSNWELEHGTDGLKTVYVQFKDSNGELIPEDPIPSDTITLDQHAPTDVSIVSPARFALVGDLMAVKVFATDNIGSESQLSEADFLYSFAGGTPVRFTTVQPVWEEADQRYAFHGLCDLSTLGEGRFDIFVLVKDNAGNSRMSAAVWS